MNGIDKITQRIGADTQAEIDRILADAAAQAEAAADKFRTQAEAEDRDLLAKSERAAAEREERLVSAAQMEARKTLLTAKQEMVERAYQRALEKLRSLPQEQYVELLAALLVRASSTGREEVIFSPEDREGAGKAAVARPTSCWPRRPRRSCPSGRRGSQSSEQGGRRRQRLRAGHGPCWPCRRRPATSRAASS